MPFDHLREWIGRSEQRSDIITAIPIAALSATLDHDDTPHLPGSELPPLWHWMYFNPTARASEVGSDGHPKRGGFLPPVELPRRMWAGGRLEFRHPMRVGDEVMRASRITDIKVRQGRSGALVFVTVLHEFTNARGLALSEEHDIVYREAPVPGTSPPSPQPAPDDATFSRAVLADPVMLFRYSALTFNGHRIHYDRNYATEIEGYPGLVVHGPLIATLLLDLLRRERPDAVVRRFSFAAQRPVFDSNHFTVYGRADGERRFQLWSRDHEGWLTMQATAEVA